VTNSVESSLCLGQLIVEKVLTNASNGTGATNSKAFSYCDVLEVVEEAKVAIAQLVDAHKIEWVVDPKGALYKGTEKERISAAL
jgi:hypothetical protein